MPAVLSSRSRDLHVDVTSPAHGPRPWNLSQNDPVGRARLLPSLAGVRIGSGLALTKIHVVVAASWSDHDGFVARPCRSSDRNEAGTDESGQRRPATAASRTGIRGRIPVHAGRSADHGPGLRDAGARHVPGSSPGSGPTGSALSRSSPARSRTGSRARPFESTRRRSASLVRSRRSSPGNTRAQAVVRLNPDTHSIGTGEGNAYGPAVHVKLGPKETEADQAGDQQGRAPAEVPGDRSDQARRAGKPAALRPSTIGPSSIARR